MMHRHVRAHSYIHAHVYAHTDHMQNYTGISPTAARYYTHDTAETKHTISRNFAGTKKHMDTRPRQYARLSVRMTLCRGHRRQHARLYTHDTDETLLTIRRHYDCTRKNTDTRRSRYVTEGHRWYTTQLKRIRRKDGTRHQNTETSSTGADKTIHTRHGRNVNHDTSALRFPFYKEAHRHASELG